MPELGIPLIATALANGLLYIGQKLLDDGLLAPPLEPLTRRLQALVNWRSDQEGVDEQLQQAVRAGLDAIGAPTAPNELKQFLLQTGFDRLLLKENAALLQETARAVLLTSEPEAALIADDLLAGLRWPSDRRPLLAQFLYTLRWSLATHPTFGALIEYSDRAEVRASLRATRLDMARTADAVSASASYLRLLLADRGLDPDKEDAQALQEYLEHVRSAHSHISFLFIKPVARNNQLRTEAELETVFVPLQVQDPEAEPHLERKQRRQGQRESTDEEEHQPPLTINEVLARYPIFLLKGAPGSGKTTLLRHLAVTFARGQAQAKLGWTESPLLPILVPLRNFGRFLAERRGEFSSPGPAALRQFIEQHFHLQDLQMPPNFFRQRLQEGRCLLLLDGLDEVADLELRATVAQMVNVFLRNYQKQGNRFGLTSRPKGYEEVAAFLPRTVVCTVKELEPEGRDELVTNLLKILEPDVRRRHDEAATLLADMRAKPKVAELSRNPLFCTTLVLVYKYRGTTLPERRVDIYHELVELMLGFWETHKAEGQGIANPHELVMLDGTGRIFRDEREAVEAKKRALVDLAFWLQEQEIAEVNTTHAEERLALFFRTREGAKGSEAKEWARNFLPVAHLRSSLFLETQPGSYAFAHQNFREHLAATALIGKRDHDMVRTALAHATESWWEEVILLAAAHPHLSDDRREYLLDELVQAGHLLLAGRCAVDAGDRLPVPKQLSLHPLLYNRMVDAALPPPARSAAGEILDELGWLPDDLHDWVRCPACARGGGDLLAMRYPVTNAHFARFVETDGYTNPAYWGGEQSKGWRWRVQTHSAYRDDEAVDRPQYWYDTRLGRERRGYPVVGVSWYEAIAFARWLTALLGRVRRAHDITDFDRAFVQDLLNAGVTVVRLPTSGEWTRLAGGVADKQRYPWDPTAGPATTERQAILARANTYESEIGGTSPVALYPLGRSQPFGLAELAGNVWEWMVSWYDKEQRGPVVRGGSWFHPQASARCDVRGFDNLRASYDRLGLRLVSPIGSGS